MTPRADDDEARGLLGGDAREPLGGLADFQPVLGLQVVLAGGALEDHCASLPGLAGREALVDSRGEPAGDVCEHQACVELRTQCAGDAECLERSR